ncbi:hypothetical protein LCGC14_0428580 [marine sediment metagenome]|uniref:Uncharacterized protein n=1 Tax=marine sediment metagenome TaxID=412755 RepID=A0A0F9VYA2_9ZZZZ
MKRNHIATPKDFHSFWPILFWYKCKSCVFEFRREPGWAKVVSVGFLLSGPGGALMKLPTIYLCATCAPDVKSASEKFLEIENGNNRKPPTTANEINTGETGK